MIFIIIILIIHIIICVLVTMHIKANKDSIRENLLPVIYMIPIFGALCYGILLYEKKHDNLGKREIGLDDSDIMIGKYNKINFDDNSSSQVVPLEEALEINNAKVRHALMIDILHRDPTSYIDMLQRVRTSDDMDVTHYATTMMMEIMTSYEKKLQQCEKKLADIEKRHVESTEESMDFMKDYIMQLDTFLSLGLVSGNIELLYRKNLSNVIEKLIKYDEKTVENNLGRRILFINIQNLISTKEYEKAQMQLELLRQKYGENEKYYRMLGKYYSAVNDYNSFRNMINEINKKEMHLSHDGREWVSFWG